MKRLILVASIMMLPVMAFAQPKAGTLSIKPKVGLNIAYFGESQATLTSPISNISTPPRLGLAAGLEFEYQVKERVGLTVGAIYSQQGERAEANNTWSSSVSMTAKTDYINFPVLVNMYLKKGFALRVSVQPGVNVKAGYTIDNYNSSSGKLSDLGLNIKKFDLSIPLGLSYEYECFVIDARYILGVVNIVDSSEKTWTRDVQITVGLKFNL